MPLKRSTISRYHAVFDPAEEGGFNVSFPNFPGCYTFGRTFEEAKQMAQEVLELWMEVMAEEGKDIPPPDHHPLVDEIHARVPKRHGSYASTYR